ncbi:hypothetical protein WJX79_000643 [Trebouxia sp. C0005]
MAADLASFQEELEDVTAFLQEANSNNATLASDLEYAHRQHSELQSKLSLQIEYLQRDVEVAQREADAARRGLRDSKEAQVQALHAQSAAFDQTLDDAKTVAAQGVLKFAAALDESQRKESEAVQRLQWSQLELHQQTAALRGEVVESRNKHMQCAQQLQDAEEELEQVHQIIAQLEQRVSSLTAALEDSKQREGLTAHKLSRCEQQLQTEVAALQLDGALASPHQGSGSQLGQLRKEELRLTDKLAEQQSKTAQAEAAATLMQISADLTHKGTGSQLKQLQKEVLSLADKLAEQQSKTAQAEAAGTLMQISVDLTKQVSDASPRPASPLVAFSPCSPLALAHSTSPSEAAFLTTDKWGHVTLSEPLGAHALASQPRIPVRQTKKQQAMMDCVAEKLVKATPGISGSVSLKNAAVHSPEGMSVHSASLQRKSRKSLSKAGGRSPFGDMTNNIGHRLVTPDRFPKLPQDVNNSRAGSRLSIGDRPLAATMSSAPKRSAGATGVTMGMVDKEPVTSVRRNQAESAITTVPALGSPIRPPSLIVKTCTDLDTVGMLCGSPANPSSISRNALGSAVQNIAPSAASLSSNIGNLQPANDSAADSFHSSGQEGSNSGEKAGTHSSPAKSSHMPSAADTTGKPKRGRARKAAPAVPSAVKTRSQIAQEKHSHRMQLRSGAMPDQSAIASSSARPARIARHPTAKRGK